MQIIFKAKVQGKQLRNKIKKKVTQNYWRVKQKKENKNDYAIELLPGENSVK